MTAGMSDRTRLTLVVLWLLALPGAPYARGEELPAELPLGAPAAAGFDAQRLGAVDTLIENAIVAKQLPGAVLLVGRGQRVIYRRAYGRRNVLGAGEAMTADTIFDLASLTKPVATAAAVWKLVESGNLRLRDEVADFIPAFREKPPGAREDAPPILIYHLLTHTAGLASYLDVAKARAELPHASAETLAAYIARQARVGPPGSVFRYGCPAYITLGAIVEKASGRDLAAFTEEQIFRPAGMMRTRFNPPQAWLADVAPTEVEDGRLLRGVVHDPLARLIGGVAGNAGLFSTADDLARFAMLLLAEGLSDERRIFAPLTVRAYTRPYALLPQFGRAPGWDVSSEYAAPRGDLLSLESFGHSGFTGTSLWIDRDTGVFVVLLSNAVHPDGRGDVTRLRSLVANVVAASLVRP